MTFTAIAFAVLLRQETPVDIPKAELPSKAVCVICSAGGEDHGEERPAGGVRYKDKVFYFCNSKEIAEFKKDPEAYMPPVLPRLVPMLNLTDLSGKLWDEKALKEKVILVDFWATWCAPCKEMKPLVEKARAKFLSKKFEVLSISIDEDRSVLDKHLTKNKFANPVLHDDKQVWARWNVRSIPAFFIVKDGQVVDQWVGKRSEKELFAKVEAHLPTE
ncbi:MAG: redoxin family protein [Fimbriimonadaceae bacterium]|nr:MAG: redoxin family protein [Fimbriimonadaceae bacterium]